MTEMEKIGETIGYALVASGKLAIFVIIIHFAWKFW